MTPLSRESPSMNLNKLKQSEEAFLQRYPGGFDNPEMIAIRTKRHNVDKMTAFAQESFARRNFQFFELIVQNMSKLVSRSSIISLFEKPRFREFAEMLSFEEQKWLADGLDELLHGDEQLGFETILELLKHGKLAKWSLMTVCQAYFHPYRDVLVKPTTVKGIIEYFELSHLQYRPAPSWTFYDTYRSTIHEMKSQVHESLSPSNTAFSWFLLLSFHSKIT